MLTLIQTVSRPIFTVSFLVFLALSTASLAQTIQPETQPHQAIPPAPGQLPPKDQPGVVAPGKTEAGEDKRVLGVLPNYRTAEMNAVGQPLTPGQKFKIAAKDSFDYPLILLGAAYAGLYQLEDSHSEFGQGFEGYMKRFGTSYCDQVTGNMFTEAFLPILLHQDPRYFRMSEGSFGRRTWYAVSRIFVAHTDSGKTVFNYSEIAGNGIASAIGLSYYPDNRNVPDYMMNWGIQLGTDATSQVLKEFWPDIKRWWYVRRHKEAPSNP
ncbi:MAG: hypothetical protein JO033_02295 [Acidobacteriaceae bacterium]|nr:hypothetical protein [Acidobacteriaceae bacterium]MBV9498833.1 hypothetical protein [Acidobacteriaceae bacterium]